MEYLCILQLVLPLLVLLSYMKPPAYGNNWSMFVRLFRKQGYETMRDNFLYNLNMLAFLF